MHGSYFQDDSGELSNECEAEITPWQLRLVFKDVSKLKLDDE